MNAQYGRSARNPNLRGIDHASHRIIGGVRCFRYHRVDQVFCIVPT